MGNAHVNDWVIHKSGAISQSQMNYKRASRRSTVSPQGDYTPSSTKQKIVSDMYPNDAAAMAKGDFSNLTGT